MDEETKEKLIAKARAEYSAHRAGLKAKYKLSAEMVQALTWRAQHTLDPIRGATGPALMRRGLAEKSPNGAYYLNAEGRQVAKAISIDYATFFAACVAEAKGE